MHQHGAAKQWKIIITNFSMTIINFFFFFFSFSHFLPSFFLCYVTGSNLFFVFCYFSVCYLYSTLAVASSSSFSPSIALSEAKVCTLQWKKNNYESLLTLPRNLLYLAMCVKSFYFSFCCLRFYFFYFWEEGGG